MKHWQLGLLITLIFVLLVLSLGIAFNKSKESLRKFNAQIETSFIEQAEAYKEITGKEVSPNTMRYFGDQLMLELICTCDCECKNANSE